MSKHTPGPWAIVMSDNATPHIMHGAAITHGDITDHDSLVCVMPAEIAKSYNSLDNAKLIAASPDLFEALQDAIAMMSLATDYMPRFLERDSMDLALTKAHAAIFKVKGKS